MYVRADYLTEKIKRLEERVELARHQIHERKAENYGFASFVRHLPPSRPQ